MAVPNGQAGKNLQTLLKAKPGDPQALLLLGMILENTRDYTTALKTLASVPALVRVQPESIAALARSYYQRADLYFWSPLFLLKHKRDQQALELLEQATKDSPDDADLRSSADQSRSFGAGQKD